jgi:hypothetical protein
MSYIFGSIKPYFRCLLRREFMTDCRRYQGEFVQVIAHAVTCKPGNSLWFYVSCLDPLGGALWHVPIQALVDKPCPMPDDMTYLQPWDCQSDQFSVDEFDFLKLGAVEILPDRVKGQYIRSIAFIGSGLSEDSSQSKTLHLCRLENGHIGAFPSNRILWSDPAFWDVMTERPDFESLHYEARAEGNQHLFRRNGESNGDSPSVHQPTPLNGTYADPKERPDWHPS